jgi:hypothetical protein
MQIKVSLLESHPVVFLGSRFDIVALVLKGDSRHAPEPQGLLKSSGFAFTTS